MMQDAGYMISGETDCPGGRDSIMHQGSCIHESVS
jgi:hypothetical protein